MVLTKEELIALLQNEVRILLHLASKVDPAQVNYRPTEKQRTTLELLQYLTNMGPQLVKAIKAGTFDGAAWGAAVEESKKLDLAGVMASIAKQSDGFAQSFADWTDADFRGEIDFFGHKAARGVHLIALVTSGYAAYRTQLFCYLKSCGQDGLNTMNLWGGMDNSQ